MGKGIQIFGGPLDGKRITVRDDATELIMWQPPAPELLRLASEAGLMLHELGAEIKEIRMPIVAGYAIWPQEKGEPPDAHSTPPDS